MELQAFWLENLRKYGTLEQLRRSAFFADHGRHIQSFLRTPQIVESHAAHPRLHSFLRNVRALRRGEKRDGETGIASLDPGAVKMENSGPSRLSDHLPIYADLDLA